MDKLRFEYKIWDVDNKLFFKPVYEGPSGNVQEIKLDTSGSLSKLVLNNRRSFDVYDESLFPNKYIIVPCIGLRDAHGEKIYEGDILNLIDSKDDVLMFEVIHDYACYKRKFLDARTRNIRSAEIEHLPSDISTMFEVVGSTYTSKKNIYSSN